MLSSEEFQHKVSKYLLQNNFVSAVKNKDTTKVKECLSDPELDMNTEALVCTNITSPLIYVI